MRWVGASFVLSVLASAASATEVNYWLWDDQQKPVYEECAKAFTSKNRGITIKLTQRSWGKYWAGLTTGFASGAAPDVFANHLSQYPELAASGKIVDLAPLIASDMVAMDRYAPGLLALWQREGRTYGLPKDWDTVAIVYNAELLKAAGVTPQQLASASWTPKDGGEFQRLLARLTVDGSGRRGDEPGFDRTNVTQFGLVVQGSALDAIGQVTWSGFAAANGFRFPEGPRIARYTYDDPKLAEAIQWLVEVSKKGYSAPAEDTRRGGGPSIFKEGRAALIVDGSWMMGAYVSQPKFKVGFTPLPKGPAGRKSMFNGLADSIWTGSKVPKQAWEWVKFLGSPACQDIVASRAVVFPAVVSSTAKAKEAFAKRGVDVSAYLDSAKPGTAVPYPVMDQSPRVNAVVSRSMEEIFLRGVDPKAELARANTILNSFGK